MAAECRLTEATSAPTVSTSLPRARTLLFLVAVAAYLTSLGNGFAYDDNWFIVGNPVVTEALIADAFLEPAWPDAPQGVGNYRPVVLTSFAVEWAVFGGDELGFHVVSVLAQGLISLLVLALLLRFVPLLPSWPPWSSRFTPCMWRRSRMLWGGLNCMPLWAIWVPASYT